MVCKRQTKDVSTQFNVIFWLFFEKISTYSSHLICIFFSRGSHRQLYLYNMLIPVCIFRDPSPPIEGAIYKV